jgi:hypothetical protein
LGAYKLIAIIWVWRCVVNGQLPVDKPFFHFAYPSMFINQPIRPQNDGMEAQLFNRNGELFGRRSLFQGVILLEIKRLQATTTSLARQLKGIKSLVIFERFIRTKKKVFLLILLYRQQ